MSENFKRLDRDDWMNPAWVFASPPEPKRGDKRYVIERQRRMITFGYPGRTTQWETWAMHNTAKDRDEAFERLIHLHPSWYLRSRNQRYNGFGWENVGHWVNDEP